MLISVFPGLTEILSNIFFMAGYVSNVNSFPQPLTPEEEHRYIESYINGSQEARNVLIERNLRLVAHIVKKFSSFYNNDTDDLISIGTIGLIKAISTFNNSKGTRLVTYAARCIENEILMHIRASKKIQNEISLQETIGVDKEGNEIMLIDIIGSNAESIFEQVEFKMHIKKIYSKMKEVLKCRERHVLKHRYGLCNSDRKTQSQIGTNMGISRSYVSRIEKKALKKLNKSLKNENFA